MWAKAGKEVELHHWLESFLLIDITIEPNDIRVHWFRFIHTASLNTKILWKKEYSINRVLRTKMFFWFFSYFRYEEEKTHARSEREKRDASLEANSWRASNQNVPFEKKNQPFHSNQIASFVQFVIDGWHIEGDGEERSNCVDDGRLLAAFATPFTQPSVQQFSKN